MIKLTPSLEENSYNGLQIDSWTHDGELIVHKIESFQEMYNVKYIF